MSDTSSPEDSFISHLVELRNRLMYAMGGFLLVAFFMLAIWPGQQKIYNLLAQPLLSALPAGSKMIATGVISPFMTPLKLTLMSAFLVSLPWIFYQVWAFVAPGLYDNEKKIVLPLVFSSSALFACGVLYCYFIVFRFMFALIYQMAPQSIAVTPDIENYLDFVLNMFLAFGIIFEVPVVVVVLVRMGVVSLEKLKDIRRYVIVGAFIIAAIVTPPDAVSQLALAVPMCLLYELGLLIAPLFRKKVTEAADHA
ncbi:twin-arginine translocase subunit TatC [Massilia sp. W12]|uniref:twin-arginine translocase subunit TatC n=1 Tax=Massilia sp. W12 TaxID=3126507 RepID=UPI0030D35AE3